MQQSNNECYQVYVDLYSIISILFHVYYIILNRNRAARINNILDNCFPTNEIGRMYPKDYFRDEVEWHVDTYPGFPERSMRTGEYLYPLGLDPKDAPDQDASLADFRNVHHSET